MAQSAMRGSSVLRFFIAACVLKTLPVHAQDFQPYGTRPGPQSETRSAGRYGPAAPPNARRHQGDFQPRSAQPASRYARLEAPSFNQQPHPSHAGSGSQGQPMFRRGPARHATRPSRPRRQARPAQPKLPERKFFEPAQIIARVGDQPIFYGEMLGTVNQILAPHKGKASEVELEQAREKIVKQMLAVTIDNKLRYLDFLRSFPEPSQLPEIMDRVDQQFFENHLPTLIEKTNVKDAAELDAKMRKLGTSLELSRLRFREQVLAQQGMQQKIDTDPEVTHAEMLDYYHEHAEDYAIPAKARWEQLVVRFDKFPSKQAAWQAICAMGNRVLFGGAKMFLVAKQSSQGFNAEKGGYHDWTNKGSLASEKLDEVIFSIPVQKLSDIIETDIGFHIVRVIERREADRIPFTEAQVEIKKKLREQKLKKASEEYLAKLRSEIDVWTIFDEEEESTASSENNSTSGGDFRPTGSY